MFARAERCRKLSRGPVPTNKCGAFVAFIYISLLIASRTFSTISKSWTRFSCQYSVYACSENMWIRIGSGLALLKARALKKHRNRCKILTVGCPSCLKAGMSQDINGQWALRAKKSFICLEGKSIFFDSFQQLNRSRVSHPQRAFLSFNIASCIVSGTKQGHRKE